MLRHARVGDGLPARTRRDAAQPTYPLRLGARDRRLWTTRTGSACSHFDAYRFFTAPARPLNILSRPRRPRPAFEQPACLHAGMDLYKHAFRLSPARRIRAGRRLLRARPRHPGPRHARRRRTTSPTSATSRCGSRRPRASRSTPRRSASSPSAALRCADGSSRSASGCSPSRVRPLVRSGRSRSTRWPGRRASGRR